MSPGGVAPLTNAATHYEHLLYKGKWWTNRGIVLLNLLLILPLISSSANGYDGSMMNGLQSVESWQKFFHHPKGGTLGLFNAIQNIGSLAGYPLAQPMADRLGRKPTIIFGAFIVVAGVIIQTACQNFGMFIGARAMIGFGTSFVQLASPLLISELAYPSQRAALTSLFNTLWFSGAIVAAWSTFGTFRIASTWSWRIPSVLQAIPSVIQVIFIWFIPESPRFLVKKGEDERAIQTLTKYHANGDRDDPLIEWEYNEIKEAINEEARLARSTSYLQLFRTPGNLKRMRVIIGLAFFSQWSGNGLISYYLNVILAGIGITSAFDQTLINGILQIFNITIAITTAFFTEKLGRRFLFIVSTAGMTLFYVMITVTSAVYHNSVPHDSKGVPLNDPNTGKPFKGNENAAHAFIAMFFLFNFAYALAYNPLIVAYPAEIMPYELRAKGLAVLNITITAALVFNQYVNPIAFDALNWKYYIVYVVWDVLETVFVYLFVIETKGRTLEETGIIFDGVDKADTLAQRANTGGGHMAVGELAVDEKELSDEKGGVDHDEGLKAGTPVLR